MTGNGCTPSGIRRIVTAPTGSGLGRVTVAAHDHESAVIALGAEDYDFDGMRIVAARCLLSDSPTGAWPLPNRLVSGTAVEAARRWWSKATTAEAGANLYHPPHPEHVLAGVAIVWRRADAAIVDFDDLTLAPIGYDLAKLIVSTVMTCGRLEPQAVKARLEVYNTHTAPAGDTACPMRRPRAYAEINHLRTAQVPQRDPCGASRRR